MNYRNTPKSQQTLLSQIRLPVSCKHKVYGSGKVVDVKIAESRGDLVLICQFGLSRLGFLYSKTPSMTLQLPASQRALYDQLLDTIEDSSTTYYTKFSTNKETSAEANSNVHTAEVDSEADVIAESIKPSRKTKSKRTVEPDVESSIDTLSPEPTEDMVEELNLDCAITEVEPCPVEMDSEPVVENTLETSEEGSQNY